ncbi:3-oxoacyl-[acyl-carrier-protein] synthase I, chloroplastic [Tanacetum coccineum]
MEARALLLATPLSMSPLRKKSSPITVKSPACTSTKRHNVVVASNATVTAPKREKDPKKRVVITGMGVVSVYGNDVDKYYDKLLAGENGITLIDKFDASNCPVRFGGQIRGFKSDGYIDEKKYDKRLDDCQRYCIVAGKRALEDAALGVHEYSTINKERAGAIVGSGMGSLSAFTETVESLLTHGFTKTIPYSAPYSMINSATALLAIDVGFMGPTYAIATACATSNYCLCAAANHIREGEADLMIAGGVESSFVSVAVGALAASTATSTRNDDHQTASRPWDKDRDGFVIGEGAGVLVMESLEHAMKRDAPIIAEYLGGAVNCDAHHITSPRPDGFGVSSCIQHSLINAGVSIEEVNYINAHATSTRVGDLAEVNALKSIFKKTEGIKVNATKSIIGHCMAAAGGMEAVATIKAIQTGWNPEPAALEFDRVTNLKQQHEINVAISNSFGFGGHNSVVAFSAFKP